jgi:hypothetical protein
MYKIIDGNNGRELAKADSAKSASEAAAKALHEGHEPIVIDDDGHQLSEAELAMRIAKEN